MKQSAKKMIVHGIVAAVCFIAALLFFNQWIGKEKGKAVAELANPSYPVMEIGNDSSNYNQMYGYRGEIDLSLVRNQITLTDSTNGITVRLHNYDYDITAIQYTLFLKDSDKPLEEGTLNRLQNNKKKNIRTGTITFKTNLKQGTEYYLKMAVRLDSKTRIYFYTKLQNGSGCHLDDYLDFAVNFHDHLFDKEKIEEISGYMEPSSNTVNNNLQSINIQSSTDALSFGNMEVKQESEPRVTIKEVNDTYTVLQVDTLLSTKVSDGVVQYYNLSENYKLRYTAQRMYLLDYDRTMDAYYNESIIDTANNQISLGIQSKDNVQYLSSDEGYKVCFASEGQLWYYDYQSSNVSRVYSLSSENMSDLRNSVYNHDIKPLKMDKKGNILYLVYGYINRGKHEGMNGIQIMRYDAKTNCNEEVAFLSTSVPYEKMKEDLDKLAYLNKKSVFYCMLDGDLHEVNIKKKKDTILESGLVNESLTASRDESIIAVEKNQDLCDNQEIEMIDLESGKKQVFTCDDSKRIRAVGFLAEDFIYGQADAADVSKSGSGVLTFPITNLYIADIDGNVKKNYQKAGRYILSTKISGSVLEMKLGKKTGNQIRSTGKKDYIRYKEQEEDDAVTLVSQYTDTYWTQLYLKFPNYVYIQVVPDLILTKTMANENDISLNLTKSGDKTEQYFVYASGEKKAVYTNLPEAIAQASEDRGNVVDSSENVLWKCVYADYAQVAGMEQVVKVDSDDQSLAGCLSMIAAVNGKEVKAKDIDTTNASVTSLIKTYSGHKGRNLTGCTTDEILYYVSQESPVLAKFSRRRYVIVMSYNSGKIRYLDPVTGQSTAVSRTELTNRLEKAGNVFYSYMNE